MSTTQPFQVHLIDITSLKPNPRNARTHSQRQIDQLVGSIQEFSWTAPIVVDENNKIIAGHGRYLAARELRLRRVPVIRLEGLSNAQKRALPLHVGAALLLVPYLAWVTFATALNFAIWRLNSSTT